MTDDLYRQLSEPHPDFKSWNDEWELYRDIIGDDLVDHERYLPRNVLEEEEQYRFRKEISRWIPETPLVVGKIVSALYKEKPKRELGDSNLEQFAANVDRERTALNEFIQRVAMMLCTYGSTRLLVNAPRIRASLYGTEVTRADEIELGVQPFLILYSPLSVIDWDVDEFGRLSMVLIKEVSWRKEAQNDPRAKHKKVTRFVAYDRMKATWWEFREEKSEQVLVDQDSADHNLGVVPMVVQYWPRKLKPMIGSGYIRYMAQADIQHYQATSDQQYDGYIHAHPTLKVWTNDPLKSVGVGAQHFLKFQTATSGIEKEDAQYMDAPKSAFTILEQIIMGRLKTIYRQAGADPLGVIESGPSIYQASGISRAWSFSTSEARLLSDLADSMVQIERQIFDIVSRYYEAEMRSIDDEVFSGSVQYPEEFDLSSTETLIAQTEKIQELINSPKLVRKLHKRIAASKVGDASARELEEIYKEIDENELIGTQAGAAASTFNMPEVVPPEEEVEENEVGEATAVVARRRRTA